MVDTVDGHHVSEAMIKLRQASVFPGEADGCLEITKIGDRVAYVFQGKRLKVENGPKAVARYRAIVDLLGIPEEELRVDGK